MNYGGLEWGGELNETNQNKQNNDVLFAILFNISLE